MMVPRRIPLMALACAGLLVGVISAWSPAAPAVAVTSDWSPATPVSDEGARVPVLVELFTSEGCSSCPPADSLLRDLLATQPVEGALVVGLSEHVDYWNRLGWADPFSDKAFSARQSAYAAATRSAQVYTPQMVVDGIASFVGSDRSRALEEIAAAATRAKARVELRWTDAGDLDVRLAAGAVTANTPVWVAIAEDGLVVQVPRGENADRTLTHDGVTRQLTQAGRTDRTGAFCKTMSFRVSKDWLASATRVTVFTQATGGPVTALGTIRVSDHGTESANPRR